MKLPIKTVGKKQIRKRTSQKKEQARKKNSSEKEQLRKRTSQKEEQVRRKNKSVGRTSQEVGLSPALTPPNGGASPSS
jgi:hypothetical protein